MKFEKDGKVYANIDALLHEACPTRNPYCFRESCMIRDKALKGHDSCYNYATKHQRETARYFGFEVIEDTPETREVVEKHGEDVKRKLTRADILHAAEKCVCGQRETDYGTPEDNFKAIAELWNVYLDRVSVGKYGNTIVDEKDVAVMMALLKIARIARGGGKADSWIDLAGYAACGAECEGVTE